MMEIKKITGNLLRLRFSTGTGASGDFASCLGKAAASRLPGTHEVSDGHPTPRSLRAN
jgi:hypothetical protein